jgi:hypothetical protein
MTSNLEKLARKPSSDPAQEHLRQHKAEWNKSTSALIAGLIALKRGLNGRGDPRAGLPPSSIKEPLPPEIVNYVGEVASRYEKVMGDVTAIVHEQEEYSHNRRKSRKNTLTQMNPGTTPPANDTGNPFEQLAVASASASELIVLGSNPLSRFWAWATLWTKLSKVIRDHRLRMLDESADFVKDCRDIKGILLEQEPESIPNTVSSVAELSEKYLGVFLVQYKDLASELLKLQEIEKAVKKQKDSQPGAAPGEAAPPPVEKPKEDSPAQAVAPVPEPMPAPVLDTPEVAKYKFFAQQIYYANFVVRHLEGLDNIQKADKRSVRNMLSALGHRVASLYALVTEPADQTAGYLMDTMDINKLVDLVQKHYDSLLGTTAKLLGIQAKDFKELAGNIKSTKKVGTYLSCVEEQETLNKMASNFVSRWLRHNLMKISPNSQQRLILDIVKDINHLIDSLDELMNALEDAKTADEALQALVKKTTALLLSVIEKVILLGNVYRSIAERRKDSIQYIMSLKEKIRKLSVIQVQLVEFLKPPQEGEQSPKGNKKELSDADAALNETMEQGSPQ